MNQRSCECPKRSSVAWREYPDRCYRCRGYFPTLFKDKNACPYCFESLSVKSIGVEGYWCGDCFRTFPSIEDPFRAVEDVDLKTGLL